MKLQFIALWDAEHSSHFGITPRFQPLGQSLKNFSGALTGIWRYLPGQQQVGALRVPAEFKKGANF